MLKLESIEALTAWLQKFFGDPAYWDAASLRGTGTLAL
jgi:hypothetical protein